MGQHRRLMIFNDPFSLPSLTLDNSMLPFNERAPASLYPRPHLSLRGMVIKNTGLIPVISSSTYQLCDLGHVTSASSSVKWVITAFLPYGYYKAWLRQRQAWCKCLISDSCCSGLGALAVQSTLSYLCDSSYIVHSAINQGKFSKEGAVHSTHCGILSAAWSENVFVGWWLVYLTVRDLYKLPEARDSLTLTWISVPHIVESI